MPKRPYVLRELNKMLTILLEDLTLRKVTKYVDYNLILSVSAVVYRQERKRGKRGNETDNFLIKFGRPNYAERRFIKICKAAGESFPVKKLKLTYLRKVK